MEGGDVGGSGRGRECPASVYQFPSCSSTCRHSKSASDGNLDIARHGVSYCSATNTIDSQHNARFLSNLQNSSGKHHTSLENNIKHLPLHLHQEKSVHVLLEKAIGRASSMLSPGHHQFTSQMRELVSEIELLEEEIADREHHVLSLYRSIFGQCVSEVASTQSSSSASPSHVKDGSRKHPSIMSNAFCSSRKFPLQHFRVLSSTSDSRINNKLQDPKYSLKNLPSESSNFQVVNNSQDTSKVPAVERSFLAHTLKDHIYQCPCRLSEELVRSMASIYCLVNNEVSVQSNKACSPFLLRSSTSTHLRQGTREAKDLTSRSIIEISSISIGNNQFSSASNAINNYRYLVEKLEKIDANVLGTTAKLAFWINTYNALVMHAYLAYGLPNSSLRRMALFHKAAYNVGGHTVTAYSIEHLILCFRTPRIGRWFENILSSAMRKKSGEKHLIESDIGLSVPEPLVLFALCTGSYSDPMLKVYSTKSVMDELERAKKDFLRSALLVKNTRKIFLPRILERYAKEACISYDDLLTWVLVNVDRNPDGSILKLIDSKGKRKGSQLIEWLPYSGVFRYVFAKDLADQSWSK